MKRLAALSLLVLVITGCKSGGNGDTAQKTTAGREQTFEVIYQGGYGGRNTESYEVITSQQQLSALEKELNIQETKKVDFNSNNVLALFLGEKRTGGYSMGIEKASEANGVLTVTKKVTVPEPGAMVTMALTAPYCVAIIPKAERVVVE